MKKKAFSFIEIITSLSLILLIVIPTLKLNIKQIILFNKIDEEILYNDFFDSIYSYLMEDNLFFLQNYSLSFESYITLKNNPIFKELQLEFFPTKKFNLSIDIKVVNTNFYYSTNKTNIIILNFLSEKRNLKAKIIKFKD
ncbi:MAG: hypothetical protein Q4A58_04745 [Fusobacterium sp.]|uniref:hypothetical protein n=1 Tax=Fusobacterium sp. TaxID=68766 RepID=UPI0026DAD968|nr:hypothetical protein [Fusobacterium sp.]MDO4690584.1 hypothetical protein [Fusobacterium sp.]